MKYALITPPSGKWLLSNYDLAYHFVLPQYLDDQEYRRMYQVHASHGHFLMMDNGAAEMGESVPVDWLASWANTIRADEIVMPDVLDDCNATLRRTHEALEFFPPRARAFCPQGKTWDEWEHCASRMVSMGGATLCIAKRYERLPGGRVHALQLIKRHKWDEKFNIHLLGIDTNPIAEIIAAREVYAAIRGVDSAAAIAYAQTGRALDCGEHVAVDWNAPFDDAQAVSNVLSILEACDAYSFTE